LKLAKYIYLCFTKEAAVNGRKKKKYNQSNQRQFQKINFIVIFIIIFGTVSFPIAHFNFGAASLFSRLLHACSAVLKDFLMLIGSF